MLQNACRVSSTFIFLPYFRYFGHGEHSLEGSIRCMHQTHRVFRKSIERAYDEQRIKGKGEVITERIQETESRIKNGIERDASASPS